MNPNRFTLFGFIFLVAFALEYLGRSDDSGPTPDAPPHVSMEPGGHPHHGHRPHMHQSPVKQGPPTNDELAIFRDFDADNNGVVTPAEVLSAMSRQSKKKNMTIEKATQELSMHDKNKDGHLDLNEFIQAVRRTSGDRKRGNHHQHAKFELFQPGSDATPVAGVLVIGNSYVGGFSHSLQQIALQHGMPLSVGLFSAGGQTLEGHFRDNNLHAALESQKWDYVIVQEQSQLPAAPDDVVARRVLPFATKLTEMIRQTNPTAKVFFLETWGRKVKDEEMCPKDPNVCSYASMQERLSATYRKMVQMNDASLCPAGTAWRKVRDLHPNIDLYGGDGSHPSQMGTHLAALACFRAMFHKPVAISPRHPGTPTDLTTLESVVDGLALP